MKILHLSTSDISGGAARAAYRLHTGLIQQGIDSKMFVRDKNSDSDTVVRYRYPAGLRKAEYIYRRHLIEKDFKLYQNTRPDGYEVFSDDRTPLKSGFLSQLPDADIYHLHWTSGFVDLKSFFGGINKPVVWTLHDMFPFTGGCHYNSGCENYYDNCHDCPQLGSVNEMDLSYKIWTRKFSTYSDFKNKIAIRADSQWLATEAKKSSLFRDLDTDCIHYGIETDEFIPRNKPACRQALNIPADSRVIVFGAPGIDNPRKGYFQLHEALKKLLREFPNIYLVSFGAGSKPIWSEMAGMHFGHIANNQLLSLIYNCADVFVIPSLQEAFGQTALEAMSCGIPVAGFNTGGIPDMIENGITGYLAETGNIENLAEAIGRILLLNTNEYAEMSVRCREKVLNGFTLTHQARKYNEVYNKLHSFQTD